jgi:glycosyltransferase involved in cell wall biosynthesis
LIAQDPVKLVSIFPSPAPYTTPVLNALAKRVDLHTIYLAGEDRVTRFVDSWGVEPEFDYSVFWARTLGLQSIDLQAEFSLGVARRLTKLKPNTILLVSWKPTGLEPLLWSRWSGSAAVMWSESTRFSGLLREPVTTRIRRWMTRGFDGYVSNGSQATRYLEELGVPSERIVTSMLPASTALKTTVHTKRMSGNGVRFLFVGRLIPRKRPVELIEAFEPVREAVPNATLTVVGRGELEARVREAAGHVPGVRYVGFREGEELASVYAESDVLVLPALREVWGVVVNEALSHGLFVVTTDQVGSAYDLLDEQTGVILPANDIAWLAPTLIDTARTLDLGEAARRRRASLIAKCTPDRFAADISRAAHLAVRVRAERWRRPPKAPLSS